MFERLILFTIVMHLYRRDNDRHAVGQLFTTAMHVYRLAHGRRGRTNFM